MAKAPVFKSSDRDVRPSGWKVGHRAPARGYGNLDGVAYGDASYENVGAEEREAEGAPDLAMRQKVIGHIGPH